MFHRTVLFVEQLRGGGISDVSQNCIICRAIKGGGWGICDVSQNCIICRAIKEGGLVMFHRTVLFVDQWRGD